MAAREYRALARWVQPMNRRALLAAAASSLAPNAARAQALPRFAAAAAYSAARGGVSFLVVRNGIVLGENYPTAQAETRWPLGQGTRAFAALLAASLIEDRLMALDEPVAMTLGDWGAHPVKSAISMRMLLNGTSGVAFGRGDGRDLAAALALEPVDRPGLSFSADAAPYLLLAEIARRKLEARGREPDPARYLTERTLAPIGCVPIGWTRGPDGAASFDTGATVSARGWAQAGELIRREGIYRARQLADDSALRETTRGSFAEPRAGIGLWLAATRRGRAPVLIDSDLWSAPSPAPLDLAMAAGDGGQRLYIVRSESLVIVRQSHTLAHAPASGADWSDAAFLSLLWREL